MIFAKWIEEDGRFAFSIEDNGGQKITEGDRDGLLLAESAGKVLVLDDNGKPIAVDAPPPTNEALAEIERAWRDAMLQGSDGVVARHRDQVELGESTALTTEQYRTLQKYRQDLRGWPENLSFPDADYRPVAPGWLAIQGR